MIDLYAWTTPNGFKPLILLEELGLPYNLHAVDIGAGEQFTPEFLRVNPNSKIPALVDGAGTPGEIVIFESGAILLHLAEKTGRFVPKEGQPRASALSWLMFQMGGVGPMFGQLGHFTLFAKEPNPYAIDRYKKETERLLTVMDKRLGEVEFLAGDYGIADMATYPWVAQISRVGLSLETWPNVARWVSTIAARPAVQKAMSIKMS